MSIPKNQHWVPRFYLKQFSTLESRSYKNPEVWIFDKKGINTPRLVSTKDVCFKRYLYSPISINGNKDVSLEIKFGMVESGLSKEWPSLANENIYISSDDPLRKLISLFVSLMILRHPDTRTELDDTYKKIINLVESEPDIENIEAIQINDKEHKFDIYEWHKFKNRKQNDHHKFFTSYIQSNATKIAEKLLQKRWSIIFSEEPVFITSDKPVSFFHPTREKFLFDFGLDTNGTLILFPISQNRILVMDDAHNVPEWQYYSPTDNNFGIYNSHIWKNSNKLIISSKNKISLYDDVYAKQIQQHIIF